MKGRSRTSPALRTVVRAGAAGAVASAVAVPLLRRRLRIPAPLTVTACAGGPLALAVLYPRSHKRDIALFAMQMWAFTMVHELPYDDPEKLRRRLRTRCRTPVDRASAPPARPLLRARLRRLFRGSHAAALVGVGAAPDRRRRGAADHGRGR